MRRKYYDALRVRFRFRLTLSHLVVDIHVLLPISYARVHNYVFIEIILNDNYELFASKQ